MFKQGHAININLGLGDNFLTYPIDFSFFGNFNFCSV